jgi:protein TonB
MKVETLKYGVEFRQERYARNTSLSALIASSILLLAFLYPTISELLKRDINEDKIKVEAKKVINYSQLSAPPPIELNQPPPEIMEVAPKIKTVKFLQPVAKKDEEVLDEELIPTMEEMESSQIGTSDIEGIDSIVYQEVEYVEPVLVPEVYSFVEQQPEFSGGEAALFAYLSANVKYPEIAMEVSVQGTVIVRFVVNEDGSIGDVEVTRSVMRALDDEAMRVIAAMPKWNPGMQNGTPVKVYFTIPIKFMMK